MKSHTQILYTFKRAVIPRGTLAEPNNSIPILIDFISYMVEQHVLQANITITWFDHSSESN